MLISFGDLPAEPVHIGPGRRTLRTIAKNNGGRIYSANGKREIARRTRQIAAGQLTHSNGLVRSVEVVR